MKASNAIAKHANKQTIKKAPENGIKIYKLIKYMKLYKTILNCGWKKSLQLKTKYN